MATEEASHTVVVVSDPDFRVHLNANELINDVSYPEWRGDHHEWTFAASYQSLDDEMRKAVKQHVKDHYAEYSIDPKEEVDIYPFKRKAPADLLRPTACPYTPDGTEVHHFVYVVPSRLDDKEQLFFVKRYWKERPKEGRELVYCGAVALSNVTTLLSRLKHLKTMRSINTWQKVHILEIRSKNHFRILDPSKCVVDMELYTGTILVLQPRSGDLPLNVPWGDLIYGPHGQHKVPACHHVVVKGLFAQAMRGEGTDLIISAVRGCSQPFQFTVHKNVMGLIPYFKSALAFRLSENRNNGIDVATLELPIDVDKVVFQEFLFFAYLRDKDRLSRLPLGILLPLLQMADYYEFEHLLRSVLKALEKQYCRLTGELAIQLLSTIEPLRFENKKGLEEIALKYIVFNFPEVSKLRLFRELLQSGMCERVVEHIASEL